MPWPDEGLTTRGYGDRVARVTQPSLIDERCDALSISALYDRVDVALTRAFPKRRSMWVRGEIQSTTERSGHFYMDLVDPDGIRDRQSPVLKVKCWRTKWEPMSASLDKQGVRLEAGMVVLIRGTLDFYKPRAELSFLLGEIDVAAIVGRLAQRRAALIQLLQSEGLLDLNRRLAVPTVPLRVGLVASPGSEGHRDFVGQLSGSAYAFEVVLAPAQVQGGQAPAGIAGALASLAQRDCDIVVIVRGGGSKADLAAFDTEPVARAITSMPVPVWVGIGHTGDQSVADIVANRSFITPTECGQEVVSRVSAWWERICSLSSIVVLRARVLLDEAILRDETVRQRLTRCGIQQLERHGERLESKAGRLARLVPQLVDANTARLSGRVAKLGPLCTFALERQADRVVACKRLLGAYDVERQLERGYTLSLDENGHLIRSVRCIEAGDVVSTRFADGTATSCVKDVVVSAGAQAVSDISATNGSGG